MIEMYDDAFTVMPTHCQFDFSIKYQTLRGVKFVLANPVNAFNPLEAPLHPILACFENLTCLHLEIHRDTFEFQSVLHKLKLPYLHTLFLGGIDATVSELSNFVI